MPRDSHPRPFTLYYGESRRVQVGEHNYHVRSRATTLIAAVRAALRRLHVTGDAQRVDVYDTIKYHLATIVVRNHGIEVIFTPYAEKMHAAELRVNKVTWQY